MVAGGHCHYKLMTENEGEKAKVGVCVGFSLRMLSKVNKAKRLTKST